LQVYNGENVHLKKKGECPKKEFQHGIQGTQEQCDCNEQTINTTIKMQAKNIAIVVQNA